MVTVLAAIAWWVRGRSPNRRAVVCGIASGVSFSLVAVFIAADLVDGVSIALVWRWQTYLVLVAGAAALVLLQLGLQAGPVAAVAPGTTLADPLVAIVLGVALFHEHARTSVGSVSAAGSRSAQPPGSRWR